MASSSSKPSNGYRVFLSFRDSNVCNYFLKQLCAALDEAGISNYKVDDEELKKGEHISSELSELNEQSHIAIVVFSKDYPSSTWCLEELAKIMECGRQGDLRVWPVFYKVNPGEVREPRDIYLEAMAKHEDKLGEDSKKVKVWKKALSRAAIFSGWHFTDGSEVTLIQQIVEKILDLPDRMPLVVAKYQVGIDSRVEEIKTILKLQSKDDVIMVGLWGQGGVGKTTLAKAIYNAIFREFEGFCFLEGVRENSRRRGLDNLQEQLLSQVLGWKNGKIHCVDEGSRMIRMGLGCKRVLIIVDDVDDEDQLKALVGRSDWFYPGSRIIVTTRNRHLLHYYERDSDHMHEHEVKVLKDDEAIELFKKCAFPENQEIEIANNLVDSVLRYAGGLPLGLEELGGLLCGRGKQEWEETLQALAKSSLKQINDVLKVSYDELDHEKQKIFLHIACFFEGQRRKYIEEVLDSCDFYPMTTIQVLIERSLIGQENDTLQMHESMQLMGRNIALEECRDDPRKRRRLWQYDDIFDVLSRHKGTNEIEAIVLKLPKPKEMHIGTDAFANSKALRLLILRNVHNSFQGLIHLPKGLRWLEWPDCASILEFGDGRKKLVGLDLRNTNIERVLKQFEDFKMLKFINFSECESLVCMPNLHCTPCLEELDLHGCKNLKRAHESLAHHDNLRLLNLSGCSKLHDFPDVLQSGNLELLNLNHCSKLQRFPDVSLEMIRLRGLYLIGTSIKELPESIGYLIRLEEMDLRYCKELAILPSSIYRLENLETLTLEGCSKLGEFPECPFMTLGFPKLYVLNLRGCNLTEVDFLWNRSCFPFLRALYLLGNNITNLPTFWLPHNLLWLDVSYCQQLQEFTKNPGQSSRLWSIGCESVCKFVPDKCDIEGSIVAGYPISEERP